MKAALLTCALVVGASALLTVSPGEASAQTVNVTIKSKTSNVVVYQFADGMWVPACKWPCQQKLLLGERYKVKANGKESEELTLEGQPNDHILLNIRHRNGWLTALGVVLAIGSAVPLTYATFVDDRDASAGARLALGGFGVGLAIMGVMLAVNAKEATVEQSKMPPADVSWLRLPAWKTEQREGSGSGFGSGSRSDSPALLMSSSPITFPLFARAF